MRRARRYVIVGLLLLVIIGAGIKVYLGSSFAAAAVRDRLQTVYGGPIALSGLDVGFSASELQGVQLFEIGPTAPDAPWACATDVDAALSLWDVLRGQTTPEEVTLTHPVIVLRFDAAGTMLTRLPQHKAPGQFPALIRVRSGTVVLRQEGRPDLTVTDVNAELRPDGERVVLSGTAVEPRWGPWTATGFWHPQDHRASLTLQAPRVEFTQAQLDQLPFVSPGVWQHVRLDGTTSVDMTLRWDGGPHHRIALDITEAALDVPSIDLHTFPTRGHVLIEDRLVTLTDVRGRSADGDIRTDGDLDFRDPTSLLCFQIDVARLRLSGLPRSWLARAGAAARRIDGRLSGHADLEVRIVNGRAQPSGEGEGTLTPVPILGFQPKPVPLTMLADGQRFRFSLDSTAKAGQARPAAAKGASFCLTGTSSSGYGYTINGEDEAGKAIALASP